MSEAATYARLHDLEVLKRRVEEEITVLRRTLSARGRVVKVLEQSPATDTEIRIWAQERGLEVNPRGRVKKALREAYLEHMDQQARASA